ncbi:MAG: glycosyltransferase family 2 protein [Desulfohalobiaceae bacterium]
MLVSVIIPTYNRAEMLSKAIGSVLVQSHSCLELIVVDDGSTDQTRDILQGIADPRVCCLSQEHQGVAAARNLGLEKASGDYIALLDSDDIWLPQKLSRQLEFTLQGGWMITQTEELWFRKGVRVNPGLRHRKRAGWIFEPSLELCLVSPSCVLFRRSLWQELGGFDPRLLAAEDYDFWLRCSLRYAVGLCPQGLVHRYAGHADQLSSKLIGIDLYRIYSLLKIHKELRLSSRQLQLVQKALQKKGHRYIQGCLKRGKLEEAERVSGLIRQKLQDVNPPELPAC